MDFFAHRDGRITVTHYTGVSITFVKGMYNESQSVEVPDNFSADAVVLAGIMREIGDWLVEFHYDVLF